MTEAKLNDFLTNKVVESREEFKMDHFLHAPNANMENNSINQPPPLLIISSYDVTGKGVNSDEHTGSMEFFLLRWRCFLYFFRCHLLFFVHIPPPPTHTPSSFFPHLVIMSSLTMFFVFL